MYQLQKDNNILCATIRWDYFNSCVIAKPQRRRLFDVLKQKWNLLLIALDNDLQFYRNKTKYNLDFAWQILLK